MPKIQCRNFPADLYELLCEGATLNERSIEGHTRFLLKQALETKCEGEQELPDWMVDALNNSAREGYRSLQHEIMKRLAESLQKDGVYPPKEKVNENVLHIRLLK